MALNQATVVETALALLREAGLPGMSMRTLATRLHVQPSALYWHFPSKQALLAAVAEQVLADVGTVAAGESAAEELRGVARALRAAVTGVPDGAEIVALGLAAGAENPVAQAVGAVVTRHGPAGPDGSGGLNGAGGRAAGLTTVLTAYVLGLALEEQTRHNLATADPAMPEVEFDSRFEAGLDALVAGAVSG